MRRVKNVGYDEDDYGDWGGYDEGWSAAPKKSAAKAKGKAAAKGAAAKGAAAPKAASASSSAAAPKAKAAAAKLPAAVDELLLALGEGVVTSETVERALAAASGRPEDAFLDLLAEEVGAGRWKARKPAAASAAPAVAAEEVAEPASSASGDGAAKATKAKEAGKPTAKAKFAPPPRDDGAAAAQASAADSEKKPADSGAEAAADDGEDLLGAAELPPEKPGDARPSISLVVVGHVDAGKSTLMGHLLCLVGNVSSKQLHKFEKESKQLGKASFAFAWVLDEGEDERSRGVTIDVCVKHFETKSRRFTILDAPGHRDFVPNMLQGAVQADVALMVVDVSHFEAGFEKGGQTKEHLQLVRSLGLSQIIVAVNKLDTCGWDKKVFESIKGRLHAFIVGPECGFKENNVSYVPLSGFSGENMLERKAEGLSWWTGPTLIEALDQLDPPPRPPADGPLRICVSDLYRTGASSTLSGKVESGTVSVGQKVLLMPANEPTTVKGLQTRGEGARSGHAGDYMDSVVVPVELQFASIGGVVCDQRRPVPVVDTFQAQILVFDVDIPLMRGQQLMCYLHTETLTATLTRLEKLIVKGKPQERRPKCLQKGNVAIVSLQVSRKVCVEPKPSGSGVATSLSRLVLRDRGHTVAAGVVLSV